MVRRVDLSDAQGFFPKRRLSEALSFEIETRSYDVVSKLGENRFAFVFG